MNENTQPLKQLPPLTEEEIASIQKNNSLLAIFSKVFEPLEANIPEDMQDEIGKIAFTCFLAGANSVRMKQQFLTMNVAVEMQQLQRLIVQSMQGNTNETK